MMNRSETIGKLSASLVKFNFEVKRIDKDKVNPHFKSDYASLDNILDEVRPLLQKHGLSVMQFPGGDGDKVTVTTLLLHESGEYVESAPLGMVPIKKDPQGVGSCITYGRRYGIAAMLGLSLGDDDDANAASTPPAGQQSRPAQSPRQEHSEGTQEQGGSVAMISPKQIGFIKMLAGKKKVKLDEVLRGKSIEAFTMEQAKRLIDHLNGFPDPLSVGAQPSSDDELPF